MTESRAVRRSRALSTTVLAGSRDVYSARPFALGPVSADTLTNRLGWCRFDLAA